MRASSIQEPDLMPFLPMISAENVPCFVLEAEAEALLAGCVELDPGPAGGPDQAGSVEPSKCNCSMICRPPCSTSGLRHGLTAKGPLQLLLLFQPCMLFSWRKQIDAGVSCLQLLIAFRTRETRKRLLRRSLGVIGAQAAAYEFVAA